MEFYKRGNEENKLRNKCKKCFQKYHQKRLHYLKCYLKKYRQKNKIKIRHRRRKYYEANKDKLLRERKIHFRKVKLTWLPYLKSNPRCEICGKQLNYFSRSNNGVYFDHKKLSEKIKTTPVSWLQTHPYTLENMKIWRTCNFGILCNHCNRTLPSKDREKWLRKVTRYVYEIDNF